MINKLVRWGDTETLKSVSQNYLKNGFDKVQFGQHNKHGIFGACPGEMLHLISLHWFKYCLDAFTSQAGGPNVVVLKHYNRLRSIIGKCLSQQSDRDIQRINVPKGFSSGSNLM
jgi:bisphosphoglycerate-dependent phosphoglycerate mutase